VTLLAGCATNVSPTSRLSAGMTKQEVISILGNPGGTTSTAPGEEELRYSHYNPSAGWEEYFVVLQDGKVTEYGTSVSRK
jgi:hypothetical protein